MIKVVENGERICTVTLDGSESSVVFQNDYKYFAVKNESNADVCVSLTRDIVEGADGVMTIGSKESALFAHMKPNVNMFFVKGTGTIQVFASNTAVNPFKSAPVATGGGGVMASGNPVTLDGLQEGVPFSEMVVSGKNLFDYRMSAIPTGIIVTTLTDGSINVSGKMERATAWGINLIIRNPLPKGKTYTLSINPDVIGILPISIYYIGAAKENQTFIWNRDEDFTVSLNIQPNVDYDFVFRPQIELGSIPTEYEPPITGRELTVNVSGKNLLSYPYYETTKTVNGITFTDNGDGTITVNGTATANTAFFLSNKIVYKSGVDYAISGCPNGGGNSKFKIKGNTEDVNADDVGYGKTFSFNEDTECSVSILIYKNTTVENIVFRPQLEIGITPTDYEPYHGAEYTITPDSNPYTVLNDIRQQDGLNVVSVSEGELSVTGVRKNAAVKKIWDEIDEIKTAIIVSNGESE